MTKIVISYRRLDSAGITGRIFDRLIAHYGRESVVMDVDNIPLGIDFRKHIRSVLAECDLLIVVVGQRWLGPAGDGTLRTNDESDPVRLEIEAALARDIPIIPVLVDRAAMPGASELPGGLKDFAFRNAAEVDAGRDFHQNVDRLVREIDQIFARPSVAPAQVRSQQAVKASAPTIEPLQAPAMPAPVSARRLRYAVLGVALVLLVTLPFWMGNSYYINIASQVLLFAVFALALNVLVGYAGLVSLGHAGLFAVAGYTAALLLQAGHGHFVADTAAILVTLAASAIFAVLALRATGIGFLMITLALGQIIWGVAYRWASLTNGDNGVNVGTRPAPFGISLSNAPSFYFFTLIVFLIALASLALFVRSPFGASLAGTRDQPRRMNALGYNLWLIRFLAIMFPGFWTGVAGLLFIYYNQFISPQVATLTPSAEVLLMVIAGGTATLFGPIAGAAIVVIMKNVVSAYIERWNLVLG